MKKIILLITVTLLCFTTGCSANDKNYLNLFDQDLKTEFDDYTYSGEEEISYLTDIYNDKSKVYTTVGSLTYDVDKEGDLVSLYENDAEVTYKKGIASWGYDASYTFTSIQENGYEFFEMYVGVTIGGRTNSMTPSFEVRVLADGEVVSLVEFTDQYQEQEFISIDLKNVEVLQIF